MGKSLRLAVIAGIPVKIHWSFLLLVLFVLYVGFQNRLGTSGTLWFAASLGVLFFCVLLHEYGHALTARRFGVKTRDIILSPIGGMARLEKLPKKPIHEFYVAIAGPLVNMVIAIVLGLIIAVFSSTNFGLDASRLEFIFNGNAFLKLIFWMNILLCGFNLIPAFPMDGGRILRSLLSIRLGKLRSTKIASIIGRIIAVIFLIIGVLWSHLFLALIGMFVFFTASHEARMVRMEEHLASFKVKDVYNNSLIRIKPDDLIDKLKDLSFRSIAKNFLVFEGEKIIGSVPEMFLWDAIKNKRENRPVSEFMSEKFRVIEPDVSVGEAFQILNEEGLSILAVGDHNEIIGFIDRHIIQNLVDSDVKK